MTGLTVEERHMALTCASNGADFMFIPSPHLCNLLAIGSPPTTGINSTMVAILLTRKPIRLDTATVVKYCRGTLDQRNTWLLDNGDIKVVSPKDKKPEITKAMADEDDENGAEETIFYNDLEDIEYD
jgi:hypothetical protein